MTVPEGHDKAAKRLLGEARMIADALRAFVPGSWVSRLDLDTLRPLPAEPVNAELHRRRGDLLWTAEFKGGGAVVSILEAQSTPDLRMPARTITLTRLVCEGLIDAAMGSDGKMPAVLPMVLYTGLRQWTPALDLAERMGPPSELAPYVAGPRYLLAFALNPCHLVVDNTFSDPKLNFLYTPGQLRAALDLPQQTYRHWKKALPPLCRQSGHSPCFSAGDLLAVAVVHNLTVTCGVRVGAVTPLAEALFETCNSHPWPVLERSKLVIDMGNASLQLLLEGDDFESATTVLVVLLRPAVTQLRRTLIPERDREGQQPLRLPPTPLPSTSWASSKGRRP